MWAPELWGRGFLGLALPPQSLLGVTLHLGTQSFAHFAHGTGKTPGEIGTDPNQEAALRGTPQPSALPLLPRTSPAPKRRTPGACPAGALQLLGSPRPWLSPEGPHVGALWTKRTPSSRKPKGRRAGARGGKDSGNFQADGIFPGLLWGLQPPLLGLRGETFI